MAKDLKIKVRDIILDKIKKLAGDSKQVNLHSKYVERYLIVDGEGCLSVSRYLRQFRKEKLISYPNPRANGHIYKIKVNI